MQGTGLTHEWHFGDDPNAISTESDPQHQYNVTTTKTFNVVLVSAVAGGCTDTAQEVITVSELPKCDFTTKVNWTNGYHSIQFIPGNSSYDSYTWMFGDGGTSGNTSPVYEYVADGVFKVKLKAKNAAGCECESTAEINTSRNLGVGELSLGKVTIYPNPSNGIFTVEITENDGAGAEIEIYNTLGERVYTGVSKGDTTTIDLSSVAKGIYIVKVTAKGKTTTRKMSVN